MRRLFLCFAIAIMLVPFTAGAETSVSTTELADESIYNCKPRAAEVEITFKPEIELKELLAWAVGFTCKKFVFDPHIVSTARKVTLIAPGKQTPAQAYDMFTTALSTLGLTVVPKGKLLQIVESPTSRSSTLPIYKDKLPDASEQVVRYVMRPQHAQPETLRQALSSFKSDAGDVVTVGALLLITDHASNVRDMASIAKLVDVPGGTDGIYAIPVKHADASKLIDKLRQMLDVSDGASRAPAGKNETGAPRDTSVPSKILVDERTNTLIVSGSEAAFQRAKAIVETLDISLDIEGGTSMHVYQLGSAIADELAKTLNDAIQAQNQSGQGDKKVAVPSAAAAGDLSQLQGPVRVISDKSTNKLLVMSSGRDFIAIRDVIRQLDVPRRQVYIEAMVLEVQLGNELNFGAASHGGYPRDDGSLLLGGVQMPRLTSLPSGKTGDYSSLGATSGLVAGILGKALTGSTKLFGVSIPSYAILFQAFADTSRTNILSTMPLIVVDNEQAKYKLGTNVPYSKGLQPTSPLTNASLSTNIDRKDLLLELEIKPHISTDDSVLLEVKQGAEDLVLPDQGMGPTWSTRSIETRVLVKDQQTIILGGLIQNRDSTAESKVPLLGDIPILGHLFKYTTKSHTKTNLLVMLTPYIIKDHLDLDAIRARKQREYEEFAGSFHNLDGQRYMPRIDYTRKRGLLEEINRTVLDIEAEVTARAALKAPVYVKPGHIEPSAEVAPAPTSASTPDLRSLMPAFYVDLPSLASRHSSVP